MWLGVGAHQHMLLRRLPTRQRRSHSRRALQDLTGVAARERVSLPHSPFRVAQVVTSLRWATFCAGPAASQRQQARQNGTLLQPADTSHAARSLPLPSCEPPTSSPVRRPSCPAARRATAAPAYESLCVCRRLQSTADRAVF